MVVKMQHQLFPQEITSLNLTDKPDKIRPNTYCGSRAFLDSLFMTAIPKPNNQSYGARILPKG